MSDMMKLIDQLEARVKVLSSQINAGGDEAYLGGRREEIYTVLATIARLTPTPELGPRDSAA
jgi:hypothetical protein